MKIRSVIIIITLIVFTILIFQNTHAIVLNLLFWEIQPPLILMIFALFVAGFITGVIYANISRAFRTRPDRDRKN